MIITQQEKQDRRDQRWAIAQFEGINPVELTFQLSWRDSSTVQWGNKVYCMFKSPFKSPRFWEVDAVCLIEFDGKWKALDVVEQVCNWCGRKFHRVTTESKYYCSKECKEKKFWATHQVVRVNGADMIATRPNQDDPIELL